MLVEGKFRSYQEDLTDAFEIRRKVFQEEQGVSAEIEFDELDKQAVHVIVYVGEKAVATGRVFNEGDTYHIGRVAVLKEERGRQYGDFVVRMLADKAFQTGADEVFLGAQISARGFYEKLGFVPCGEEYIEADILHVPMKLKKEAVCSLCKKEKMQN